LAGNLHGLQRIEAAQYPARRALAEGRKLAKPDGF
jgi:hypothetical protein